MALAVHAAQTSHRKNLVRLLDLTIVLGTAFLVIKGFEWHADYVEDLIPFLTSHFHLKQRHRRPPRPSCFSISIFS